MESDRSGNNKHATQSTASKKTDLHISDALLKNKATISSSSATGQIGLALPSIPCRKFSLSHITMTVQTAPLMIMPHCFPVLEAMGNIA